MKKVILNYDEVTGNFNTDDNMFIGCMLNANVKEIDEESSKIEDLIRLKNAGFNTDDILKLNASIK